MAIRDVDAGGERMLPRGMGNVLDDDKKHQVVALWRLGWSLRRIEDATDVRRETASGYLKAAGVPIRRRGDRPRAWPPKPATTPEVSTDLAAAARPERAVSLTEISATF